MFKLVISDTLVVPVAGVVFVEGKETPISFDLLCKRSTSDEIQADLRANEDGDVDLKEFMRARVTGWRNVQDESGAALEFGDETREALLNFPGVAALAVTSYVQHCGAKGKQKNLRK